MSGVGDKPRVFRIGPDGATIVDDSSEARRDPSPSGTREAGRAAVAGMSFPMHVLSLNATALIYLGLVEGQESERDLEAAAHIIDTLEMLKEKTAGNLTSEEARLLGGILHELRMKYVQHR